MRTVTLMAIEVFLESTNTYQYSHSSGQRGRAEETYTASEHLSTLSTREWYWSHFLHELVHFARVRHRKVVIFEL